MSVCRFLRVSAPCVRVCVTESVSVTVCLCVPVSACCLCLCFCRLAKSWNLLRGLTCRFCAVRRQVTVRSRNDAQDIGKRNTEARCTEWGLGLGGWGLGGWAYRVAEAAQRRFQYPAAAAVGSKQCGRSQLRLEALLILEIKVRRAPNLTPRSFLTGFHLGPVGHFTSTLTS